MTLRSTTLATDSVPRAALWGIGRDHVDGQPADFHISWEDWQRDTAWAESMLAYHGVGSGTAVLIIGGMPESPWFDPFETAVLRLGGHYSLGEIFSFEAFRAGMYATRLGVDVVFGINRAVAEGLGDELGTALAGVRRIFARPDAVPVLEAAGLTALTVSRIGPALAVSCTMGDGAHVNTEEWLVEANGDDLLLTTVGPRAHQMTKQHVGVTGHVTKDPCACGRLGARVYVSPDRGV
ncbi:MAG TPA: hypothetical protein VKQ07_10990 [Jatrophihabitantaceae bacterium]|nr:hypothetical protein [Jatrophihabitantaceae bacterium]